MNPRTNARRNLSIGKILLFALAAFCFSPQGARDAGASCDLHVGAIAAFPGDQGVTNRPFAAPGEGVQISLRGCDSSAGLAASPTAHNVTVIFTPPSGERTAVVLTSDVDCSGIQAMVDACESALPGSGKAFCVPGDEAALGISTDLTGNRVLGFRFPDTDARCIGGADDGTACRQNLDCDSGVCDPDDDERTLSGPAMIVVTDSSLPLQCGMDSCASATGTVACVGEYFRTAGTCSTSVPGVVFPGFTALAPPNNYANECIAQEPPCNIPGATDELRSALDARGNSLTPFVWNGIREQLDGEPVARLLTGTVALPTGDIGQSLVASYAPDGRKLDPVFEPKPAGGSALTLFGSADAPYTILRVARGSDSGRSCVGGTNAGAPCNLSDDCDSGDCEVNAVCVGGIDAGDACVSDETCDGGVCGTKLFDLSPLLAEGGVGPVVLDRAAGPGGGFCQDDPLIACTSDCGGAGPCVNYVLEAGVTVPLEGLVPRDELGSFAVTERIDLVDLNNDGDTVDVVLTQRDSTTGAVIAMGPPAGASCGIPNDLSKPVVGRSAVRNFIPPLRLPAGATEAGVLAFLESESGQNGCDLNGDGDAEDAILRIFDATATELSAGLDIAVDPTPTINNRSIAISEGKVFVKVPEADNAQRLTTRANTTSTGGQATGGSSSGPSITSDGQYVAFASGAGNLSGPADNGARDVFLKNLITGAVERISDDVSGTDPNSNITGDPRVKRVGNAVYTVFATVASNSNPSDPLPLFPQLNVYRTSGFGTPVRFSKAPGGGEGNGASGNPDVGYLGRVVYESDATNMQSGLNDNNGVSDIYVSTGATSTLISRPIGGGLANGSSSNAAIAADKYVIAFESSATNLVTPDGIARDVFVYDGSGTPFLERISASLTGGFSNSFSNRPDIDASGRYVSFDSLSSNLVVGDTNGNRDVFVRDRELQRTYRVSVATGGGQANGDSYNGAISGNGYLVMFKSDATNLVSDDVNGQPDYFIHNLLTGETVRANVDSNGAQGGGEGTVTNVGGGVSDFPTSLAVFESIDSALVAGDTNGAIDIVLRTIDPNDPLGVDDEIEPDGALNDTGLVVVDVGAPSTPIVVDTTIRGPGGGVRVADGKAAYAKVIFREIVVDGSDDTVLHFWQPGSSAVSLNKAIFVGSTALSFPVMDNFVMTPSAIGMFVSEAEEFIDQNGDGVRNDGWFEVHDVCSPIGSCSWSKPLSAGNALMASPDGPVLAASADIIAVPTSEAATGSSGIILNGDSDDTDVVLQVYDHSDGSVFNTQHAIADVVVGDRVTVPGCGDVQLVAYRVNEFEQGSGGGTNLNNAASAPAGSLTDFDTNDSVLHVYNAAADPPAMPVNTGQAVTACRFASCDPRTPYRVDGPKVVFLTRESEQGGDDLSGEGDPGVDLVVQTYDYCGNVVTTIGTTTDGTDVDPTAKQDKSLIAVIEAARCDSGDCSLGCDVGEFCETDRCLSNRCERHTNFSCSSNDDCDRCIQQFPITCLSNDDCLGDAECNEQLITAVASAEDDDFDGVPNNLDACPQNPNPTQSDVDGDGTPDACDIASCPDSPVLNCRIAPEGKASLQLKDIDPDDKDQIKWRWSKGAAVTKADYGDPAGSDTYEYCLYDASGLVMSGVAQSGKLCGSAKSPKPCWKEFSKGFKFKDKTASPLGVDKVLLKEGESGKPKASFKGKGELVPMPALPSLASPLTLQLFNNSNAECWTSTFAEPFAKRDATQIKAKSIAEVTTTTTTTTTTTLGSCDPFLQDCPGSNACYFVGDFNTTLCAGPAGSGTQGTPCSATLDCAEGFQCIFDGISFYCSAFCGTGLPSCSGFSTCADVGSSVYPGIGVCIDFF